MIVDDQQAYHACSTSLQFAQAKQLYEQLKCSSVHSGKLEVA
jgi:hypothetical protein